MTNKLSILLVVFILLVIGTHFANKMVAQPKSERDKVSLTLVKPVANVKPEHWLRIETKGSINYIAADKIIAFSFTDKEDLLRNTIYFSGGKVETTATEKELMKVLTVVTVEE